MVEEQGNLCDRCGNSFANDEEFAALLDKRRNFPASEDGVVTVS
jgi:hypothetical protein